MSKVSWRKDVRLEKGILINHWKQGFRINSRFADSGTIKIEIKVGVKILKTSFPYLEESL